MKNLDRSKKKSIQTIFPIIGIIVIILTIISYIGIHLIKFNYNIESNSSSYSDNITNNSNINIENNNISYELINQTIFSGSITVKAGTIYPITFYIPPNVTNPVLYINVYANDMKIYLLTYPVFLNYEKNNYFASDIQVGQVYVKVPIQLPPEPEEYVIVFDNEVPIKLNNNVDGTIILYYYITKS